MRYQRAAVVLALLWTASACRERRAPPPAKRRVDVAPSERGGAQAHLPLRVGARWTFRITKADGRVLRKTTTVEALEDDEGSGTNSGRYRLRTVKANGDVTVTWERDLGRMIVVDRERTSYAVAGGKTEEREERWQPFKVRLDTRPQRLAPGARWQEQYQETRSYSSGVQLPWVWKKTWTVEAVDEEVVVPAGRFRCLRLRMKAVAWFDPRRPVTTKKTYWYAPGVGKVKESGGQLEELESYDGGLVTAAR